MAYFSSAAELDRCVGGILRLACAEPSIGSRLAGAATVLRLEAREPDAAFIVVLDDPLVVTQDDGSRVPDVMLSCTADLWDRFWRGQYSLLDGLATGEVTARGPISRVLKHLPVLEPLFPAYCALVADKDQLADGGRQLAG